MNTHVILCSYNGEAYIKEQIDSILKQDIPIKHFHIFDFSSKDRTVDIINEIKFPALHLHTNLKAEGAAKSFFHAFNTVSKVIQDDDCIFLVDQDDVWLPHKSSIILNSFKKNIKNQKNLVIAHDVQITDENLNIIASSFYTGNPYQLPRDLTAERVLLCNPVIGHTMAISGHLLKNICKSISIEKYLMHDWAITLFAQRYGSIIFLPNTILSLYRQHNSNVLGAMRKTSFAQKIKRTFSFSKQLIDQSLNYGRDIASLDNKYKAKKNDLVFLQKISHSKSREWLVYPYLIQSSLVHGPTMKRKSLSVFFLIHWMKNICKK